MDAEFFKEEDYQGMPETAKQRCSQMPITWERFRYLTETYIPRREDAYVLFHHPGHFLIYDQNAKCCVLDLTYLFLSDIRKENRKDEDLVAVISEFNYNQELLKEQDSPDAFSLAYNLIEEGL